MNRSLSVSLLFLFAGGSLFAQQQDADPVALRRANLEAQFDQFDIDGSGTLSLEELEDASRDTLVRMREKGLDHGEPVTREEFVAAGLAPMVPAENKDLGKDDDRRQRKELKWDEASSSLSIESSTSSPTGHRRGTSGTSRFAPRLPAEFLARDKNGDGQIGLYEWDRAKYAEFVKLDKNGDGFLTASELLSKDTKNVRRSDSSSAGTKLPASRDPIEQDPIGKEARETFTRMDKNGDGGIAEDEWASSQRVRPMFENAGIHASLPIEEAVFVASFRQAKASETPRNNNGR
jgi:Ca2+-binding EF-hand superfamily protein